MRDKWSNLNTTVPSPIDHCVIGGNHRFYFLLQKQFRNFFSSFSLEKLQINTQIKLAITSLAWSDLAWSLLRRDVHNKLSMLLTILQKLNNHKNHNHTYIFVWKLSSLTVYLTYKLRIYFYQNSFFERNYPPEKIIRDGRLFWIAFYSIKLQLKVRFQYV